MQKFLPIPAWLDVTWWNCVTHQFSLILRPWQGRREGQSSLQRRVPKRKPDLLWNSWFWPKLCRGYGRGGIERRGTGWSRLLLRIHLPTSQLKSGTDQTPNDGRHLESSSDWGSEEENPPSAVSLTRQAVWIVGVRVEIETLICFLEVEVGWKAQEGEVGGGSGGEHAEAGSPGPCERWARPSTAFLPHGEVGSSDPGRGHIQGPYHLSTCHLPPIINQPGRT